MPKARRKPATLTPEEAAERWAAAVEQALRTAGMTPAQWAAMSDAERANAVSEKVAYLTAQRAALKLLAGRRKLDGPPLHAVINGRFERRDDKVLRRTNAHVIDAFSARHRDAAERIIEAHWTVFEPSGTKDPLDQRIRGAYSHLTENAIDRAIRCKALLDGVQRRTGSHGYHLIERAAIRNDDPARWEPHVRAMLLDALDVAADFLLGPVKG